jgi:oligosaccharide amylase
MPRSLVLGNGSTLVCLDQFGFVRDFYFPYVGLENHVSGHKHRIGVQVNGIFSWLDDGAWQINLGYKPETMVGYLVCKNETLGISLVMEDIVYNESNIFLRKVDVYNHHNECVDVKVFFHQVFLIAENKKRNTAFFDPTHTAVVHYRGRRVFIVNGRTAEGQPFDDFSLGAYQFEGKEGTFKDAEDGQLGKNAVEHGSVDSVVRFSLRCDAQLKSTLYYWITAGKSLEEAYSLNEMVMTKSAAAMLHSTEEFWRAWLNKRDFHLSNLSEEQAKLFKNSLYVIRAHVDNRGSIIASADSEMIEYGKDDYAYMWPRDAAFIVSTLDRAGFTEVTKPFFQFCQQVLHPDGYLHHRFNSDGSLGSTWHSAISQKEWLKDKILQLPIQEDESAAVLVALWNHYDLTKDLEFIESIYKPFIEKIAQFLVSFRNKETGLPLPSYDLWEEYIGISTYTCCAVYGGLMAAANFSEVLGKRNHMREYRQAAKELKEAMSKHLYSSTLASFVKGATIEDGQVIQKEVIDASTLFGLWYFNVFAQDDPLFTNTQKTTVQRLTNPTELGGIIRYEHDTYFKDTDLPNPWIITTLWEAQRRLRKKDLPNEDLEFVRTTLDWVTQHQSQSGVLPEQMNPYTHEAKSATPLVWSHAVYVETVLMYIETMERLGLCSECKQPPAPNEL